MSARGVYRGIYSALADDPDYQALSPNGRLVLLTARICKQAGPAGIFRYYPALLAEQTGLTVKAVEAALADLEAGDWIRREGPILWIRNALRHDPSLHLANGKHRTAVEEWLKELPRLSIVLTFCEYYQIGKPFESHTESPANGPRYIGRLKTEDRRLKTEDVNPLVATPSLVSAFEDFWRAWPETRRVNKADAVKAWRALDPDPSLRQIILAAVTAQKQGAEWQREGGKYIPHPHRWLGKRRWEDAPPAAQATLLTEKTSGNQAAAAAVLRRYGSHA